MVVPILRNRLYRPDEAYPKICYQVCVECVGQAALYPGPQHDAKSNPLAVCAEQGQSPSGQRSLLPLASCAQTAGRAPLLSGVPRLLPENVRLSTDLDM